MGAFGDLIRKWRTKRNMSQLALATNAGTTSRHLSFLETGRSRPTEEMILRLSATLEVPFRERNMLFRAAGFSNKYQEHDLDSTDMTLVRNTIDSMLKSHEPFPATVLDRKWNIVRMNRISEMMIGSIVENVPQDSDANILELFFHPNGLRQKVLNWPQVARQIIQRIYRESFEHEDAEEQIARLRRISDLPDDWWQVDLDNVTQPILTIEMDDGQGGKLNMFSLITSFGTPIDVTAQELRIEFNYPADDHTKSFFENIKKSL